MTYRRKDAFYRRARAAGYRARSAYKLAELNDRFHLLRRGDRVADLGAWPGGWLQVALEQVGPEGKVVGIDLAPIDPLPNAFLLTGDIRDPAIIETAVTRLGSKADVVLSDLAPKLTGVRATDEARSAELVEATLGALPILLRPGGRLLAKLFMSAGYLEAVSALRSTFTEVRTTRPQATRQGSSELYVCGLGYRS